MVVCVCVFCNIMRYSIDNNESHMHINSTDAFGERIEWEHVFVIWSSLSCGAFVICGVQNTRTHTHTSCGNYRHFDFRARFATSILSTQQVHTQPATDNLWNAHFCLPARVVLSNSILTLAVQLFESISIPHFLRRLNLLFGSINATRNLICRNEYLWMCNSGHSNIGLPACAHTYMYRVRP